jgi:hypothetical protein
MDQQQGSRIKKRAVTGHFAFSLAAAVLLIALGFIKNGSLEPFPDTRVQLIVVCVSGFSWDRVIPLHRNGKLPFLAQLFQGKGSCGDIISTRPDPDPAIVASLFTGCFPGKHSMYREADLAHFNAPGQFQKPIWQELADRGQASMVVGLPAASGQEGFAAGAAATENTESSGEVQMQKYLRSITAGARIPDDLLRVLQECVCSDMEHTQQAIKALDVNHDLHLFSFFQGLGRWQRRLLTQADALPDRVKKELIDNYYIFFDAILARLYNQCGENGIFLVLSERGNVQGRPANGNYLPRSTEYPASGFFYAAGLHIRQGIEPVVMDPADLVPTLLYLTGNPFINRMDGRVIFKLLEEHYYFKRKIISNTKLLFNR